MMFRISLFALLCVLVGIGCRRGDKSELARVSGTVTFDGEPLPQGTIIFESAGSRPANGLIENGQIVEVTTYEPNDGVPVGKHKVAIQSVTGSGAGGSNAGPGDFSRDPSAYMSTASLIPRKYGDPSESGLTAEISSGTSNQLEFQLTKE